jgi:hypothetical protein
MVEHVTEWLNAYLDGELNGMRLIRVQAHLAECETCQAELEDLRNLSALLQETSSVVEFTPTERFAAQVALRLPHRESHSSGREYQRTTWWLVPVGLFAAWVFLQVTLGLSALLTAAGQTGLLDNVTAWLQAGQQHSVWVMTATNLFAGNLNETGRQLLQFLGDADVLGENLFVQVEWQIGIAVLYWGWLIFWWLRQRHGKMEAEAVSRLEVMS